MPRCNNKIQVAKIPSIHAEHLIIATNRGPVEYYLTRNQTLRSRRGSGGMITALIDAHNQIEMSWVAMAMTEGDRLAMAEAQQQGKHLPLPLPGQNIRLHYVSIPKSAYHKYYDKVSNHLLWFLQHYLSHPLHESLAKPWILDAWQNGYQIANQVIADAICDEIEHDCTRRAVVMLHDYHLYLASAMIRQRHPTSVIQHFVHIPWPDIRCWYFLPGNICHAIFRSLISSDIIGFQTLRDARNFLEGVDTLLDGAKVDFEAGSIEWHGHRTQTRAYPISISVTEERKVVKSAPGRRAADQIKPLLGKRTIMRVDRLEPTKNILRGFQAYGQMLKDHPELHGQIAFLAFLVPSRQNLPEYKRYTIEVMRMINALNQTYGTEEWQPITVFYGNDRTRALAAMQFYDVLLVNAIIDGMNLVAKEGPTVNQNNGVLVLSRTLGAFQQLANACISTSPIDVEETEQALYTALTLSSEERLSKAMLARSIVEQHNLAAWMQQQIADLNELLDQQPVVQEQVDNLE